jgi:hypothetical protein
MMQPTMTTFPTKAANIIIAWMLLTVFFPNGLRLVTAMSEEWCLERGFDPSNLACDTCALLEESTTLQTLQNEHNAKIIIEGGGGGGGNENIIDISAECRTCCQKHKVNPLLRHGESLRGKYRYALLTYNEQSMEQYGEIRDFLDRDLDNLLAFKGESRLKAIPSQNSIGRFMDNQNNMMATMMMMGGGGFGFGGGPPKLMLFEKQKQGGWSEEDEMEAGEVISLRGWKREDVNDMLMTLLPNA